MVKRLVWALLMLATMTGCSVYHKELDNNPPFSPHRFSYYDVEITWRSAVHGTAVVVRGTIDNRRSYYLRDLELTARLMDQGGKVLAEQAYADFPTYLPPGGKEPFSMEFSIPSATRLETIRFSYYYWLTEAAPRFRGKEAVPTFGGFTAPP